MSRFEEAISLQSVAEAIAVLTAKTDLRAADPGVKRVIRPFKFRVISHVLLQFLNFYCRYENR
jgi:hypothetical protein